MAVVAGLITPAYGDRCTPEHAAMKLIEGKVPFWLE
jgi:hypothetical protein